MSLSVFSMALEENRLKQNGLTNERNDLLASFESGLGREMNIPKNALPQLKTEWPALSANSQIKGARLGIAKTELDVARSEYELQKAESWPDLSLGPRLLYQGGAQEYTGVGAALSLSLPLYQVNGGGRARALSGVKKQKAALKFTADSMKAKRTYLVGVYNRMAGLIIATLTGTSVEVKHKGLHSMINRGVVSAPLVIEFHRQVLEYYQTLHRQELDGIRALWQIRVIDGEALKEIL